MHRCTHDSLPLLILLFTFSCVCGEWNTSATRTAEELNVPRCESNSDCVQNGVCRKGTDSFGRCLCPGSCNPYIPYECKGKTSSTKMTVEKTCLLMNSQYKAKYDVADPVCYQGLCACPPNFEEEAFMGKHLLPPTKCDRREMDVTPIAHPSTTVFRGAEFTMFCCLNMDPRGLLDANDVQFVQNTTIIREASSTPFEHKTSKSDRIHSPWCWRMHVSNVQLTDSGTYACHLRATESRKSIEKMIDISIKVPRSIERFNVSSTATNARVTWEEVEDGWSVAVALQLVRRTDSRTITNKLNASSPYTIENLSPATPYTFHVTVNDGHSEPFKFTQNFQTSDDVPQASKFEAVRLQNGIDGQNFCEIEWKQPKQTNGRITKYMVRVRGVLRTISPSIDMENSPVPDLYPLATDKKCANFDDSKNEDHSINPVEFMGNFYSCSYGPLKPNRNYSVSGWAENSAARSPEFKAEDYCVTDYAEPDNIEKPKALATSNATTFKLVFDNPPDEKNGPIKCFYVVVVPLPSNVTFDMVPEPNAIVLDTQPNAYANNRLWSAAENKRFFAYVAESYSELPAETIIGDSESSIQGFSNCSHTYLNRFREEDGPLKSDMKYTGFLIVRVDKFQQQQTSWKMKNASAEPAYGFSDYFKPVFLHSADEGGLSPGVVVLIAILFFLSIVATLTAFLAYRGSWCPLKKAEYTGDHLPLYKHAYDAVPAEKLPEEYIMKHRDSDYLFIQEFDSLPNQLYPATVSSKCPSKNRYKDILAYDETRVKLQRTAGVDCSDYINANWIKAYDPRKTFIAAQAPVDITTSDFWRMIWENEVRIVVMLSNLVEKNRSQSVKYYPDEEELKFGEFCISTVSSEHFSDHAVRHLDVTYSSATSLSPELVGSVNSEYANLPNTRSSINSSSIKLEMEEAGEPRRIVHFHFTAWNDYKAPENPTGLLRFLHKVRLQEEYVEWPVLVHCSAGVGRTGTYIAIDSLIDQMNEEGIADIFGFVSAMRKQRNLMVQNCEQYQFIYRALAEHQLYGETDMDETQFLAHYKEMTKSRFSSNGKLQNEFKLLSSSLDQMPSRRFADENPSKNRFPDAVPFDKNRIMLAPVIGNANHQYINASSIKGYFFPYILAQDPMSADTVFDFWRMIIDQEVSTIVMLTPEEDLLEEEKYWPTAGSEREIKHMYKSINVELKKEERYETYTLRTLMYSTNGEAPREVRQLCARGWKGGNLPTTQLLINLIGRVLEIQSYQEDSAPILLHCRNGSSEAGVFCAASLLIERLKAEKRIDIFKTVHSIQAARSNTFTRLEEYELCYKAVADAIQRKVIG